MLFNKRYGCGYPRPNMMGCCCPNPCADPCCVDPCADPCMEKQVVEPTITKCVEKDFYHEIPHDCMISDNIYINNDNKRLEIWRFFML